MHSVHSHWVQCSGIIRQRVFLSSTLTSLLFSSSAEEKEDLWRCLFFYLISLLLLYFHCWHSRGNSERSQKKERKKKILSQSSTLPLFISTGLSFLFVLTCLSSLPGISSCLQTEVRLNRDILHSQNTCFCSAYFQTLSYCSVLSSEPQGQMMKGANERM